MRAVARNAYNLSYMVAAGIPECSELMSAPRRSLGHRRLIGRPNPPGSFLFEHAHDVAKRLSGPASCITEFVRQILNTSTIPSGGGLPLQPYLASSVFHRSHHSNAQIVSGDCVIRQIFICQTCSIPADIRIQNACLEDATRDHQSVLKKTGCPKQASRTERLQCFRKEEIGQVKVRLGRFYFSTNALYITPQPP